MYIRIFQFKKYKSQLNVIYKWTQYCHLAPGYGFCDAALFFLCACYYFQVDASQCGSHVSHLQFKLEAPLKYEVYYLHPKQSFHVIQPGLSIEPDFPLHGLTCTENPGKDISSKYKLHTTRYHLGKRISNSH